ncbi:receptor-like protein 9DC3 [Salvia splendens]|uniref:receptor-like protein 9DC3 n=1 Tax=Salvia splendens TaxID=180675 RepID=UPI001C26C785|nr:receptor-like protein 9DC3 [Salvia splendens]
MLQVFDVSRNAFTGNLPHEYLRNFKGMIDVQENHQGEQDVSQLYIDSLTITMTLTVKGGIPASLGNITELESLDLSSNRLEGEIPTELTKLTFLSVINISGKIPQSSGQFSTFENTSYVGNSGLCGIPLSRTCEEPSPPVMLQEDDDYGILEGFGWQAVVSSYGC